MGIWQGLVVAMFTLLGAYDWLTTHFARLSAYKVGLIKLVDVRGWIALALLALCLCILEGSYRLVRSLRGEAEDAIERMRRLMVHGGAKTKSLEEVFVAAGEALLHGMEWRDLLAFLGRTYTFGDVGELHTDALHKEMLTPLLLMGLVEKRPEQRPEHRLPRFGRPGQQGVTPQVTVHKVCLTELGKAVLQRLAPPPAE